MPFSYRNIQCLGCASYQDECCLCKSLDERFQCNLNNCFYWPLISNEFMKLGISDILSSQGKIKCNQPVIFLELTLNNLAPFFNMNWKRFFTGMRIILLPERRLEPLANFLHYADFYFFESASIISGVFHCDDITNLVRLVHHNDYLPSKRNVSRLTLREYTIFKLIYQGVRPKKIATQLGYSVKTIYAYKERIGKKMGVWRN